MDATAGDDLYSTDFTTIRRTSGVSGIDSVGYDTEAAADVMGDPVMLTTWGIRIAAEAAAAKTPIEADELRALGTLRPPQACTLTAPVGTVAHR